MRKTLFLPILWVSLMSCPFHFASAAEPEGKIFGQVGGYQAEMEKKVSVRIQGGELFEKVPLDPQGQFERKGLPPGDYDLWVESDRFPPVMKRRIEIQPQQPSFQAELLILEPLRLEGRVLDEESGLGVPKANVVIQWLSSPALEKKGLALKHQLAATDSQGLFACGKLVPGTYRIIGTHPDYRTAGPVTVQVPENGQAAPVTLRLQTQEAWKKALQRLAALEGKLTLQGQGLPKRVAVFLADGQGKVVNGRFTHADGTYRIEQIPPGAYTIRADPLAFEGFLLPEKERRVLFQEGQTVRGIDFNFIPATQLKGTVRETKGDPVPDSLAAVQEKKAEEPLLTVSDAQGQYKFEELTRGDWSLEVRNLDYIPAKHEVPLKSGEKKVQDVVLKKHSYGSIAGEIRSLKGQPLTGIRVAAILQTEERTHFGPAESDSRGRFKLTGLLEGTYAVQALGEYGVAVQPKVQVRANATTSGLVLKPPMTAEERLAMDEDFQRVASFVSQMEKTIQDPAALRRMGGPAKKELPSGGRVEGMVLGADGRPAPQVVVVLLDSRRETTLDFLVETDSQGRFVLEGVPDGSYFVQAGTDPKRRTAEEPLKVSGGRADQRVRLTLP